MQCHTCAHYQAAWRLWQGRVVTAAHQRTGPVQSRLQFQSSKSKRTEAENRATVSHISAAIPPELERHPFHRARAAWDAVVPTRRGRRQRLTERGRGRVGGECIPMATVCFC
ncbi:hypothetical protein Q5P01_017464 [Channa striata]|uniref:Uncharacterized protein n=1 Tax=Channa striata TaxID=64152 RepID=A0AA88MA11_CHASR|nr:hypothetical protein Q5P01_017464 [Channa striata]